MIKGVSDVRRLPRLGKIRLGVKEESSRTGNPYPRAVDYFVCPEPVQKIYGPQPRQLDVMFPLDDLEIVFPQWYASYGQGTGLKCKGDGETAWRVGPDGSLVEVECAPDECEDYQRQHCRRLGRLQVLLPRVPGVGVWEIATTSFHSIVNINSYLELVRGVAGRIALIPLTLYLEAREVQPEGKKKVVHVMNLRFEGTMQELMRYRHAPKPTFLLAPPDDNDRPEDLYPDEVLTREKPQPLTLPSAEKEYRVPPKGRGRSLARREELAAEFDGVVQEGEKALQEAVAAPPQEAATQPESEEPEVSDDELHALWDKLGTPMAKRQAVLAKTADRGQLLEQLRVEVAKRGTTAQGSQGQPQGSSVTNGRAARPTGTNGRKAFF